MYNMNKDTDVTSLGTKIVELRERIGMTTYQLAKEARLTTSSMYKIESNGTPNPGVFTIKRIAKVLNVPIAELIEP